MEQTKQNKEFIIRYLNAISGVSKTRELLELYITDQELIEHILYFDTVFPEYEMFMDEITAEGNRVVVRGRCTGVHRGNFNGMPATHRNVDFPFVVSYDIENGKIAHYWFMADQALMMEQLGVMKEPVAS